MRSQEEAFAAYYASMPDEQLLRIAANLESLLPVAQTALVAELVKRGKHGFTVPAPRREPRASGSWEWPVIFDEKSAKKAAVTGAGFAFAVAAITGVFCGDIDFSTSGLYKTVITCRCVAFWFFGVRDPVEDF